MKRAICLLIAMMMILGASALAYGIGDRVLTQDPELYPYEPSQRPLYVVNCNEWISVRTEPNTQADRLGILPLGSCIYHWAPYNDEFIYFDLVGDGGFVLWEYLSYDPLPSAYTAAGTPANPKDDYTGPLHVKKTQADVDILAEPRADAMAYFQLAPGMIIDNWEPYNDEYILYDFGATTGYVSWDYLEIK